MATYTIDLNTRLVPRDRTVWRLFPGDDYAFLPSFEQQATVFLNLPGLQLPAEPLSPSTRLLDARILAARRIRSWAKDALLAERWDRVGSTPEPPARDPSAYADRALPREAHSEKGSALALFGRAKRGDLVVVPDRIPTRRVLIGEFVGGPAERETVRLPDIYGIEAIPARRVRWLARTNELTISPDLSEVLRRPYAMTPLSTEFFEQIFDKAYGSYQFGLVSAARLRTRSQHFTGGDNLDLGLLTRLAAATVYAQETGDDSPLVRLSEVIDRWVPPSEDLSLSININSPGDFILKAAGVGPLVFAALFALLAAADAGEMPTQDQVRVVNSAAGGQTDDCTAVIDERVRQALSLWQMEVWKQACERRRSLAVGPQVNGDAWAVREAGSVP